MVVVGGGHDTAGKYISEFPLTVQRLDLTFQDCVSALTVGCSVECEGQEGRPRPLSHPGVHWGGQDTRFVLVELKFGGESLFVFFPPFSVLVLSS